jgi:Raf kinase inhibitor-like YbhB/YbcL family protein
VRLESASFREGEPIPKEHSRDGADSHPALAWSGAPAGTRSFALVCEDPDAPRGTWIHWVLFNVPETATGLDTGAAKGEQHPSGGVHGRNDFGESGWGGPAPPRGHGMHHYVFRLFALDTRLGLPAGASRSELEQAMQGHVLAEAKLTGTYRRD